MHNLKLKRKIFRLFIAAVMGAVCLGGVCANPGLVYASDEVVDKPKKLNELKALPVNDLFHSSYKISSFLFDSECDNRKSDLLCIKKGEAKSDGGCAYLVDGTEVKLGPNEGDSHVYFDVFVSGENSCFANLKSGDEVVVKLVNKKSGDDLGVFKATLLDFDKSDFYNEFVNDPLDEKAKDVEFVKNFKQECINKISSKYSRFFRIKLDNFDEKFKFTDPNNRIDETKEDDYAYLFMVYENGEALKSNSPLGSTPIWC